MENKDKEQISFTLKRTISTNHHTGTYRSGKAWGKWAQVFRGEDGVLYSHFGKALAVCDRCTITGTYAGVSPHQYKGEKVLQVKNAKVLPPAPEQDTDETEAESLGDNIELHRKDNPYWYVTEGREHLIEQARHDFAKESLNPDREAAENYAAELEAFKAGQWSEFIKETKNL